MRTLDEIKAEIDKLTSLKARVPRRTLFGDDNHEAIDAQIKVLDERMDEDGVWAEWPEEDSADMRLRENALEAVKWLEGENDQLADDPEGWLSTVKDDKK